MADPVIDSILTDSAQATAIPIPVSAAAPPPSDEPEFVSETLYIQNLNEKIKIGGAQPPSVRSCGAY